MKWLLTKPRSLKRILLSAAFCATACSLVRANDVQNYFVEKGHLYTQTSNGSPVEASILKYAFSAAVLGDASAITSVDGNSPSGFSLSFSSANQGYVLFQPVDSLNNLNLLFGSGVYTISIDSDNDGFTGVQLTLGNPGFPTAIPHVSNFTAAQSINPDADFTISWDAFAGAGANDYVEFDIEDSGTVIFSTTTDTSAVIPDGLLAPDTSYDAVLRFVRVTQTDTTGYPGATGTAGFFNATQFSISTGTGGGGTDSTPPFLFFTAPLNNAVNVGVNTPITFSFSEPMAAHYSIQWSANVNPTGFTYSWSGDGQTLTATYGIALPANAVITWKLNPTPTDPENFQDVAGNLLPANIFQGTFTTGTGMVDPCNTPPDLTRGFLSLNKTVHYRQTNNSAPVFDTGNGAVFTATFHGPSAFTTTAVNLTGPGGVNKSLDGQFGYFTFSEQFGSAVQVDTAYATGDYTFNATTSAGAKTVSLTGGTVAGIPVPQILNVEALASLNVSNAVTIQFTPFAGAGQNDSIFLQIADTNGADFYAPDLCHNISLAVTDSSITIPAGTLKSGSKYDGSITFTRRTDFDTNSLPNTTGTASVSTTTLFSLSPGVITRPSWNKPAKNPDGSIELTLEGQTGSTFVVEGATTLGNWSPVSTNVVVNGLVTIKITPGTVPAKYFRAKSL